MIERILNKKTLYIAGPMAGLPARNAPAFNAAAADLRQRGYNVVNPIDLDLEVGFDPSTDSIEDFDLAAAVKRDVNALTECDAIAMLPGHEASKGATAERHVAIWLGKEVLSYPSLVPLDEVETALDPYAVKSNVVAEAKGVIRELQMQPAVSIEGVPIKYDSTLGESPVDHEWLQAEAQAEQDDGGFMPIGHEKLAETLTGSPTGLWIPEHDEASEAMGQEIADRLGRFIEEAKAEPPKQPEQTNEPEDVLLEAYRITNGDRNIAYGRPDIDFTRTAGLLSVLFADKLKDGEKFESWEVAQLMICLKLSRLRHAKKRDSIVDIAGYARCMDVCYTQADVYAK